MGAPSSSSAADAFPSDTSGLDPWRPPQIVRLDHGDIYELRIAPVAHRIGEHPVRMLAYNGSIPGPTMRVRQGSEITVRVHNDGDHETTVHWHGVRVSNEFDGVPFATQAPIPVGGVFDYQLRFPDDGLYWYHPHVREDYGLEMGLYGNFVVDAVEQWPPVDREVVVTLDDLLIEDGRIAVFSRSGPTYTAMGRFGNVMLTAGRTHLALDADAGDVVRLFLTNTANTRIFNILVPGATMKLVAGDSGRYEHEAIVDAVLLAPSERAVIDVLLTDTGEYTIKHQTPDFAYTLGTISVSGHRTNSDARHAFDELHANAEQIAARASLDEYLRAEPDKTLVLDSLMPLLYGDPMQASATSWTCPMHAEVLSDEPGTCPKCGMKLIAADVPKVEPLGPDGADDHHTEHAAGRGHGRDSGDGLEWEDLMPEMNAHTDAVNMVWKLRDEATGRENMDIDWSFRVGERVKIRLVNTMDSDHPMHHPFHVHGAGRFLVLSRGGVLEPNLVWKDTVLIRAGETIDILLTVDNPGLWMAHCHIAEHNQNGMMFNFRVN